MPRSYSPLTIKRLFSMSGQYCAFPACNISIFENVGEETVLIGEIAHIESSSDIGPRANPALTERQRDSYANLVVLCPTHHTLVDKADSSFSVSELQLWKADVERATADRLSIGSVDVTFAELSLVCDAFADGYSPIASTPMVAVGVEAKMLANGLTGAVRFWMTTGLSQAWMVADFMNRQAQIIPTYPEKLRAGFVNQYNELRSAGTEGDDLFFALVNFGAEAALSPQSNGERIWVAKSAALAVICHLFEVCDLFEVPA
jgi:hypothetical protein